MRRINRRIFVSRLSVLLGLAGLLTLPSLADSDPITGSSFTCTNGKAYWLFVGGETGTCKEVLSGVLECTDIDDDYALADCSNGCETFTSQAGCNIKIPGLGLWTPVDPLLTIECDNGKIYKMEHDNDNGRCQRTVEGGETVGGQCTGPGGAEDIDSRMDCEDGCEFEEDGASCECVSCGS